MYNEHRGVYKNRGVCLLPEVHEYLELNEFSSDFQRVNTHTPNCFHYKSISVIMWGMLPKGEYSIMEFKSV